MLQGDYPSVTIGMPVHNGEEYIAAALDSVLAQTYPHFELLISDNASQDKTESICLDYCRRDSRIRYVKHLHNRGGLWNFNFVAQQASGTLFTWLAHDDILEPDYLELSVQFMTKNPAVTLACCDVLIIDENETEIETAKLERIREDIDWRKRRAEFFQYPFANLYFCIYGLMNAEVCKSVIAVLGEPRVAYGSEAPFLARFALSGEVVSIPLALRKYRRHDASAYMTEDREIRAESRLQRRWIEFVNLHRYRIGQMMVLLSSSLPTRTKLGIMWQVHLVYTQYFLAKLGRFPAKLARRR